MCELKVLDQPVNSEVKSMIKNGQILFFADNLASSGAKAKFRQAACSSRQVEHVTMILECQRAIFSGKKIILRSYEVITLL